LKQVLSAVKEKRAFPLPQRPKKGKKDSFSKFRPPGRGHMGSEYETPNEAKGDSTISPRKKLESDKMSRRNVSEGGKVGEEPLVVTG